jgi:hypothetical protein
MTTCISYSFAPHEKSGPLTLNKLFYLANKQHTILAYEEANQLLAVVQAHVKKYSLSDAVLENIVEKTCSALTLGRDLSLDEEIELLTQPNQILVDD